MRHAATRMDGPTQAGHHRACGGCSSGGGEAASDSAWSTSADGAQEGRHREGRADDETRGRGWRKVCVCASRRSVGCWVACVRDEGARERRSGAPPQLSPVSPVSQSISDAKLVTSDHARPERGGDRKTTRDTPDTRSGRHQHTRTKSDLEPLVRLLFRTTVPLPSSAPGSRSRPR